MSLDIFKGVRRFARSKSALISQVEDDGELHHAPVVIMTAQDRARSWSHLGADATESAPAVFGMDRGVEAGNAPAQPVALGESIAHVLAAVPKRIRRAPRQDRSGVLPLSSDIARPEIDQSSPLGMHGAAPEHEAATVTLLVSAAPDVAVGDAGLVLGRQVVRGGRTLLLNLERSEHYFGLGLSDLLDGGATFTDVIRRDEGSRLHCIELGQGAVALGEAFDLVIEALAQTYSFLIINAGPADGMVSDALAPICDMAVLSGSENVRAGRLELLRDRLRTAGAPDVLDMPHDVENRQAA